MDDREKSDGRVLPVRLPNNAQGGAAEVVEGRRPAKGNATSETCPGPSAGQGALSDLDRVRRMARTDKEARFTALLHHVHVDRLRAAYLALEPKAAPGVDGVTWEDYGEDLEANLRDLHARVHRGAYRARPSRRTYIPKPDGRLRPLGVATVRQNQYSLPVRLAGSRVAARIGAREIVFSHDGKVVARHERLLERFAISAQLDHYLELLKVKPGALSRSLALRQEREQGRWPASFDELWKQIEGKVGSTEAARQMVDVLMLCRELSAERVELAVRGALAAGAHDGRAVAVLARRAERPEAVPLDGLTERLASSERSAPGLSEYDQLLAREQAR